MGLTASSSTVHVCMYAQHHVMHVSGIVPCSLNSCEYDSLLFPMISCFCCYSRRRSTIVLEKSTWHGYGFLGKVRTSPTNVRRCEFSAPATTVRCRVFALDFVAIIWLCRVVTCLAGSKCDKVCISLLRRVLGGVIT